MMSSSTSVCYWNGDCWIFNVPFTGAFSRDTSLNRSRSLSWQVLLGVGRGWVL